MLRYAPVSLALASLVVAGGGGVAWASPSPSPAGKVSAELKDAEGRSVGTVEVEDVGDGKARVRVRTRDLPPGFHGLHLHDKGVCDASAKDPKTGSPFASGGSHRGTGDHPDHEGDLPNLLVGKDGTGDATYVTDRFGVEKLISGEGSSVMVHEKPDNHGNIPERYTSNGTAGPDAETRMAGDSGGRIACAELKQPN
jgi:Cu/Zn superoxide dismutase